MKILVIDDEKTILNNVYEQLCTMNLPVESIETANGTEEARKLMEKQHFDIYICDIVMPGEDGISFAKWVLEKYRNIKFVFLTAHADYNYMKEAISMQSFDYLLQPASAQELQNVVERAISQIRIEKKNQELMRTGAFFSNDEENILEGEVLKYLFGEKTDTAYLERLFMRRCERGIEEYCYMPVLVQVQYSEKQLEKIQKTLRRSIYYNILDEIIAPLGIISILLVPDDETGSFYAILCADMMSRPERITVLEKMETLRQFFEKLIQTKVAIYCGNRCSAEELCGSLNSVVREKENNIGMESRVFSVSQCENADMDYSFESQVMPWKNLLKYSRFMEFKNSIFNYMEQHCPPGGMNREYMMKLHCCVSELILGYLVHKGLSSDAVFDEGLPYLSYMTSWQTLDSFCSAIEYVTDKLQNAVCVPDESVVDLAIKYIRRNMDRDVSVSEIADYIGMNPEYFTKLFKKKTGYTLKEFIGNEKMETAKMLLRTTELPITLISDHVGYGNYSNFTRGFKQLVGCTPTEYRKAAENQKM